MMKPLSQFIIEKLKIQNANNKPEYTLQPKDKKELIKMIKSEIKENGKECSLNHIDTSLITDMSMLFSNFKTFDGDISDWDVSNVKSMAHMFTHSKFTGKNSDISNWKTSGLTDLYKTFFMSKFEGDISNWDVSNVTSLVGTFESSVFNGDLSKWDTSNVEVMDSTFAYSKFEGDISMWNVDNIKQHHSVFDNSPLHNKFEKQPKFKK